MISNEERRIVAARLRRLDDEITSADTLGVAMDKMLKIVYDNDAFSSVRYYARNLCGFALRLADLIDRPTCHMDCTETIDTDRGKVRVYVCDECGLECEEVNGSYGYCPRCGAEVVDRAN